MKMKTTTLFGLGIILFAAAYVFAMVQGGFLPWFVFTFVLVVFAYEVITFVVGVRFTRSDRQVSAKRLTAGQTLGIDIFMTRSGWWPMFWLRVTDELPSRWVFQRQGGDQVLQPLWARQMNFHYQVTGLQRGVYKIGSTTITTGDLLGIIQRDRKDVRKDEILVYPKVVPVRGWSGNHPEELGLRQPTRRRTNESSNVIGVRNYVPGDRLSRIHWPASARKGVLQAKEFELHVSSELMFVPDLAQSSFQNTSPATFELEMTIVASLIKYTYEVRRMFGFTMHGEKLVQFPAGMDEALFLRCMDVLATANPNGRTDFPSSMTRIAQEAPQGATLVVVSPKLSREAAVAAEVVRRRTQVEWFVPIDHGELSEAERQGLQMLQAARVNVYLIGSPDQLANLQRGGGIHRATGG
jgi:uncharacterized protein (DUF58 family)